MSNRDQTLLIALGTAVVAGATWYFWLSPLATGLQQLNSQLTLADQQKSSLTARLAFVDAANQDVAAKPEIVKLLNLAAPGSGGMENLLASFDAMASTSGVTLSSLQPATVSDQPTQLTLTVGASGSFSALQSFVTAIEQNVRPLAIQTVSLSSTTGATGGNTINASFSITTPVAARTATTQSVGTP